MKIDILSLFPEYFDSPLQVSILGRAIKSGLLEIHTRNIRDFGLGKWKQVDDSPFGGSGMLLMAEPVVRAIRSIKRQDSRVIYLSPQGTLLTAGKGRELARYSHLIFLCGHYEGIDDRALVSEVDEEISIGDYVLTNGGIAALVVIDTLSRFIPGVLGNQDSTELDSLENGLLKGPQYTRPRVFEGKKVPEVLLQGNHQAIAQWRQKESLERTRARRPDLYMRYLYRNLRDQESTQESRLQEPLKGFGELGVVLEVNNIQRSKKFYSKLFRLDLPLSNRLYVPGKNPLCLYFQEAGSNKQIATLAFCLDDEDNYLHFLKRWKMLGGTFAQANDQGVERLAYDLDGHIWAISFERK
ncbi:tRNA (guanosine(37)-N1)-methyltransferase TrmD [Chlamydia avium]|uniref:tRNA (guanine-N(1)-)-methyltransferase n=1 Tax=Chlamydia avium 10DC88 TaxID=1229831 RepID=W8JLY4_9CHLA|nr:tRNA (guanosine(37)-N1)-methyltransferase TrmD [Chlamydia avium]AHK63294.1 tRNA (guanine-N(1)-)-methyltransferase [Chlamydia avium 10DC88]